MRATTAINSPFDVFRFVITPKTTENLTDTPNDEQDVSISADASMIVWQGMSSGRATIFLREYINTTFTQSFLNVTSPQIQPSISGDSHFIALVRQITSTNSYRILTFRRSDNVYTTIASSTTLLEHPSVSDDGNKVVWLQNGITDAIRIKNVIENTITNIVSSTAGLSHPFLTATGKHLSYSQFVNNTWNVRVRDLSTNTVVASTGTASPVSNMGAYWQDIGFYIESGIIGQEWIKLFQVMKNLPLSHRGSVIIGDSQGNTIASKSVWKGFFSKLQQSNDNVYLDATGREFVFLKRPPITLNLTTQANQTQCQDDNTGARRRLFTSPGSASTGVSGINRYAYMYSDLYLPASGEIFIPPNTSDKPYVMMGGRGKDGVSEIDAGFQYDELDYDGNGTIEARNWAFIFYYWTNSTGAVLAQAGPRYNAGQQLQAEFYIASKDTPCMRIQGAYAPATDQPTGILPPDPVFTYCTQASSVPGLEPDGRFNSLKRETAIAQVGTSNFSSGAYINNVGWWYVRLGSEVCQDSSSSSITPCASNLHFWGQYATDTAENCKLPNTSKVTVDDFLPYYEDISINLNP
jgi:hypothetical protein